MQLYPRASMLWLKKWVFAIYAIPRPTISPQTIRDFSLHLSPIFHPSNPYFHLIHASPFLFPSILPYSSFNNPTFHQHMVALSTDYSSELCNPPVLLSTTCCSFHNLTVVHLQRGSYFNATKSQLPNNLFFGFDFPLPLPLPPLLQLLLLPRLPHFPPHP